MLDTLPHPIRRGLEASNEPRALQQLELRIAEASAHGASESELRRLCALRLAGYEASVGSAHCRVDQGLRRCLHEGAQTIEVWRALAAGLRFGELLRDAYRDGFQAGFSEALDGTSERGSLTS